MSLTIAQVNTALGGDTWQIAFNKINQSLNAVSTIVVSVNSHANGGLTSGNGFVEGTFGARNLVANTFRGGTVQTPAFLTISSNVSFTGANLTMGVVVVNTTDISINGVSITEAAGLIRFSANTIGTTDQEIHNFNKLVYRGGEYAVTVRDTNANQHQLEKVLVVHDSGSAYTTEYGVLITNTNLGEISANANATHVRLYLSPTVANTRVSGSVILVNI